MTTQQLKSLAGAITTGDWRFDDVWHLVKSGKDIEICAIHAGTNHPTRASSDVAHANAELITKAPELLHEVIELRRALKNAIECLEVCADDSEEAGYPSRAESVRSDISTYKKLLK